MYILWVHIAQKTPFSKAVSFATFRRLPNRLHMGTRVDSSCKSTKPQLFVPSRAPRVHPITYRAPLCLPVLLGVPVTRLAIRALPSTSAPFLWCPNPAVSAEMRPIGICCGIVAELLRNVAVTGLVARSRALRT
jgi:hypothetical protein